jgi:replicative DNA helicase
MTHTDGSADQDIFATLTGLAGRIPVSDAVKVSRAALEIASAVARQAQAMLTLQQENTRLRERLVAARAEIDSHGQQSARADAEINRLRRAIMLLTEPVPAETK